MLPPIETDTAEQAIAQIEAAQLTAIASRALAEPVTVTAWQVALLGGLDSSPLAAGVYQVWGTAVTAHNISRNWRVVAKILRSPAGFPLPDGRVVTREMAEDQHSFGYWQRERLAAQSDLFYHLPSGLRVPRCLAITPASEDEYWLWQEYLPEDGEWTMGDYHEAAYRLGQWQAAQVGRLPDYPWLSQEWLARWVNLPLTSIVGVVEAINGWQHPLLTAYFAPEELAALQQLWVNRQQYLERLAQLPQTLCHLDVYRANMRRRGDDLVLLDWAFVGQGALGEELAALVGATLLLAHVPLAGAEELERAAFAGYVAGLRAAGWADDTAVIAEAYRCAMPLRYAFISLASMLRTAVQPDFAADWERQTGQPLADILAHRAGLVRFYLSRLDVMRDK
ncbi:MAG TPA: hypothetical protein PLD25_31400 [Chloroflexota bacterium]|nr:hypothetical protein [Chloroflexota bacterium]HUM68241.1 hypothetical protein [Chloroflexota bacterium]